MIRFLLCLVGLALATTTYAQRTQMTITGTILEAGTEEPVGFANVAVGRKKDGSIIDGASSELDGTFSLSAKGQKIFLEISFLGYQTLRIDDLTFDGTVADLGVLYLNPDSQALEEVVVRAEKSSTEFKLDKRVFNVGQDLSSTGASALEVLNNVPSVNVNIEGEVSLRGSTGVQILINGKPSILTNEQGNALGTITADMIEQIEVITNPSAKYEAEGTSGIINIVMKKDDKQGLNGSITLNTGIPDNHSVGLSINKRSEKFNIFSQAGVGYRSSPNDSRNTNINKINGIEIRSEGEEFRNETFYNFVLGSDYYVNKNNVITLSGSYSYEIEDQPSETQFTQLDAASEITKEWTRNEITEATNPKFQYELQYKKQFEDNKEHSLQFSAIGNFFGKAQSSDFSNTVTLGTEDLFAQKTATEFKEGKYTFNLDYTKPISKEWSVETGAQYVLNDVSNDFEVSDQVGDEFIINPGLTNVFEYNQKVLGVYGTTAYEGSVWGIKVGLRAENTDLRTFLVNTNEENKNLVTNYFPSAHTSYKFSDAISFQAGYSKRIYRPRLWDLNPFFNIRNNFNIRAGNPNLLPEFTDSYEIGSIFIFEKITYNINVYHRYTTEVIDRVSTFENDVTTTLPINVGTRKSTGAELNFKYSPIRKLTFNGDFNYFMFIREGLFLDQNFDFSADQWSAKITTKYKYNRDLDFEITNRYQSDEVTLQGTQTGNFTSDLGLRYKIMKGRAVFNFSVRDIFASRIRETFVDQPTFSTYSRRLRGRFITFGFSYGFGKGEAMRFGGGRRR